MLLKFFWPACPTSGLTNSPKDSNKFPDHNNHQHHPHTHFRNNCTTHTYICINCTTHAHTSATTAPPTHTDLSKLTHKSSLLPTPSTANLKCSLIHCTVYYVVSQLISQLCTVEECMF